MLKNFLNNNLLVHIDRMLDRPNIANGLIEETTKKKAKRGDYGIATIDLSGSRVIKEDGDLEKYMPDGEQQNKMLLSGEDAMWCVSENGACNPIETLINYFISLKNKADDETKEIIKVFRALNLIKGDKCLLDTAYVAVGSGTSKRGNSYQKVGDFIRKYGLIPKGAFPNYGKWKNWNDLYYAGDTWLNGNKINKNLLEQGKRLLEYIDIGYAWYGKNDNRANERGCPGTSVGAWGYPVNGVYVDVGIPLNHAVYRPQKTKLKTKLMGDSYDPFKKQLDINYTVGYDFLISIRLKKPITQFNEDEVVKHQKKGRNYLLLVDNYNNYTPGLYNIKDKKLVKIELPEAVDKWIKELANKGELVGINKDDFSKLVNF